MHKVRVLCGAVIFAALAAPAAHADEWNKLTYFTFSAPVELPGMVLPAGTYRFELADPDSGRRVVRVSDKEGGKVLGTFLSISDQKMEPSDKAIVMFKEAPAGAPEAVKAWFYPGETYGYELVYPHDQALKIAKAFHSPVLTANGDVTGRLASDTTRIDENDRAVSMDQQLKDSSTRQTEARVEPTTAGAATTTSSAPAVSAPAPATTGATAQTVEPPTTVTPQPVTTPRGTSVTEPGPVGTSGEAAAPPARRRHLPKTASSLSLLALLSGLSLAGAFGFRALRRTHA